MTTKYDAICFLKLVPDLLHCKTLSMTNFLKLSFYIVYLYLPHP